MTPPKRNIAAIYPLSPMQEGILFHTLYAPQSSVYFEQYSCDLQGDLDVQTFKRGWRRVIDRHPPLRSLLTWERRAAPLQIVRHAVDPPWHTDDWRGLSTGEAEQRLTSFFETDREQGFVLDRAPLMRFALFQTADDVHKFVWSFHHVMLDGWSMRVVLDEVFRTYDALVNGGEPQLDPPRPYQDFITWLEQHQATGAEDYWKRLLKDFAAATRLRTDTATSRSRWATEHQELDVWIDAATTARLKAFARRHRLTVNTLLRGAWALLLHRYSGEEDVVFGATVSGRPPELDGIDRSVGLFINTLPVRIRVTPDEPLVAWLEGIQRQQIETSPYDWTPLPTIQAWSDIPRGESLFDTLLVVENLPEARDASSVTGHLTITDARYAERSHYPLAVVVVPGHELRVVFIYDRERFDSRIVRRMADQLKHVLETLEQDSTRRLGELPFFPQTELRQILVQWNETRDDDADDGCVHDLIDERAREQPDTVAVMCEGRTLSYAALDARAARVAQRLRAVGVGPEVRVGLLLERSLGIVVGILGILKAGGAYVPLDPRLPASRLRFVLRDAEAAALVAGTELGTDELDQMVTEEGLPLVSLDADGIAHEGPAGDAGEVPAAAAPASLAYVIYTSGSTGRPKGVAVEHRNLAHSTRARMRFYPERVASYLLLSPLVFDSSVAGIFWTLCQGGTLVLPAPRMEHDVHHLAELIETHAVSHLLGLPTLYGLLLEHAEPRRLGSLRTVILAGEACPPEVVRNHFALLPRTALYNEYGPTEATVWCTVCKLTPQGESAQPRVPIGRPIANVQAYILDAFRRPVPVGVPGELYVGGANLARGYLNRPELTAERFIRHPLPGVGQTRLYRTGDVARFLPDGTIDLLGRADHQVKIRGQRIELEEVEAVLKEHPSVRDAVVVLKPRRAAAPETTSQELVEALRAVDERAARTLLDDVAQLSDAEADELMAPGTTE